MSSKSKQETEDDGKSEIWNDKKNLRQNERNRY